MLRKTLSSMLAALLVVGGSSTAIAATAHNAGPGPVPATAPGVPAPASPVADPKLGPITLSGTLNYVTNVSAPHYEVNGYVLVFQELSTLDNLAGQQVIVTGTPVTGPSIYMRKSIAVASIIEATAYIPPVVTPPTAIPALPPEVTPSAPPAAPPAGPATPAFPTPSPDLPPLGPSQIPAPALRPFWGSPYYILTGQVETNGIDHTLVQETRTGMARLTLRSNNVDLAALAGQRVSLIASRDPGIEGSLRYNVIAASVVSGSRGERFNLGPIYLNPLRSISIIRNTPKLNLYKAPIR